MMIWYRSIGTHMCNGACVRCLSLSLYHDMICLLFHRTFSLREAHTSANNSSFGRTHLARRNDAAEEVMLCSSCGTQSSSSSTYGKHVLAYGFLCVAPCVVALGRARCFRRRCVCVSPYTLREAVQQLVHARKECWPKANFACPTLQC